MHWEPQVPGPSTRSADRVASEGAAPPSSGPGSLVRLSGLLVWLVVYWFCLAPDSFAADGNTALAIDSVTVDGKVIPVVGKSILRLPPNPGTVSFHFNGSTSAGHPALRVRHRLDVHDPDWQDGDVFMYVAMRFFDQDGKQVSQSTFKSVGESRGWKGEIAKSAFTHRRETVVAPPGAATVWAVISSAGPPQTVGLYAVNALVISRVSTGSAPGEVLLQPPASLGEQELDLTQAPADWMRDGLSPNMAKVIEVGQDPKMRALAILDEDVNGHAEWHTIKEFAKVSPGDHLLVEWNELFTMGLGIERTIAYTTLPTGDYRFRLTETTTLGTPTGAEFSLAVAVPVPYGENPWFWGWALVLVGAVSVGSYRYIVWQQMRRDLAHLEQQRVLERERLRIAQDIHDDLGARVTQISLLSAVAQSKASLPEEARAEFGKVSQMTRDLVSALYETVWAVNPENDNLDALATYLCQVANQLCSQAPLRCRLEVPDLPPSIPLSSQARHNLIMAVKEAVNNVIKHARASEVRVSITFEASVLSIIIHDDGCGFEPSSHPPGHGLGNLKRRLDSIGGGFTIQSQPGQGTTVRLRLPVPESP